MTKKGERNHYSLEISTPFFGCQFLYVAFHFRMNYLSEKFNFDRSENDLSKLLQIVKTKPEFLDLTSSNPTLFFEYDHDKIRSAFLENSFFPYAPDPQGIIKARLALVNYYHTKGRKRKPENFFFTSGTSEAMSFILKAICNPDSEILLPTPGYPLYDFIFNLENCESRNYLLYPERSENPNKLLWKIDFQSLEENINKNTKAIVIVEPHNPTGARLIPNDVAKLILIAKSKKIILIIDEVFSDYYEGYYKVNSYTEANCIYLNGLSKTLALPQMKLSWIYLDGDLEFVAQMKDALEIVSDTYLSVNIPVQLGLEKILETSDGIQLKINNRIRENCFKISQLLKANNSIEFFFPDGGWAMILKLTNNWDDENFAYKLLKNHSVYVYPGYMFDMPESCYIVISLILPTKMIEEGIARIIRFATTDY